MTDGGMLVHPLHANNLRCIFRKICLERMVMKIRCLVTAGPTREFFDPVRYISNPSSGKMGFAIAAAARKIGWQVDLVAGPVSLPTPEGCLRHDVVTGEDMYGKVSELFPSCTVLIMTAAVCDFRPKVFFPKKQKKSAGGSMTVEFEYTRDILKTISGSKQAGQMLVGFAAETDDVENYAKRKLLEKDLDWIVANQVGVSGSGFESDMNTVTLFSREGQMLSFGPDFKKAIAEQIVSLLNLSLAGSKPSL